MNSPPKTENSPLCGSKPIWLAFFHDTENNQIKRIALVTRFHAITMNGA